VDSARRSGDLNLQAETLSYLGAEQATLGQCPAAMQAEAAAQSLVTGHARSITRESKLVVFINEVHTVRVCAGDLRPLQPQISDVVTLARQIRNDSLQEENPPLVLKTAAVIAAAIVLGCDEGRELRHEALALAKSSEDLRGISEMAALTEEGECLVKVGRAAEAVPVLRRSLELYTIAFGPRAVATQIPQADLTYALAQSGQAEEAIRQAKITLANLAPLGKMYAQRLAVQALMASGDTKEALPVARELISVPAAALAGKTCLFVASVEAGQYAAAKPYRAEAERQASVLPAGTPWRVKIEAALRKAAEH
jgi:hypothetical protein